MLFFNSKYCIFIQILVFTRMNIEPRNSKGRSGVDFRGFLKKYLGADSNGSELSENDKNWVSGSLGSVFCRKKKNYFFSRHFPYADQIHAHIAQIFFIFEKNGKSELSLRFQNGPDFRDSVGICPLWSIIELKIKTFESF